MSQLLALSFDCPTSPELSLSSITESTATEENSHGWGIAWYPTEDFAAAVIKDTKTQSRDFLAQTLSDWKRFNSTLFLCHLRGASKRISQQDTQPFSRSHAGRDWLLSHSGDLISNYKDALPLGEDPLFEPIGKTDSEHAFCWLLAQIARSKARKLKEVGWEKLHASLKQINDLGTANIIISDGIDMIVYQDQNGINPLYWLRDQPPHKQTVFGSGNTKLEIGEDKSAYRTFVLISNYSEISPLVTKMQSGQMIVIRRGNVIWNSHDSSQDQIIIQPEAPAVQIPEQAEDFSGQIYNIYHRTTYNYEKKVELSKHFFRLHPVHDRYQEILSHEIILSSPYEYETYDDVFGNKVTFAQISKHYKELTVTMQTKIKLNSIQKTHASDILGRRTIPLIWLPWQRQMMMPYLLPQELPETQLAELTDYAMSFVKRNDYDVYDVVNDINQTIYRDYVYESGSTSIDTTPFEVYYERRGVCQDFANLFICLARLLSIPARYRTGYIYTGANYENTIQSDASHAWVEVYLPWLGWRGFDPTNGSLAEKDHIKIACGRNYYDATPTQGTIYKGGGNETLDVEVKVEKEDEAE